jgi:hypothetical protein
MDRWSTQRIFVHPSVIHSQRQANVCTECTGSRVDFCGVHTLDLLDGGHELAQQEMPELADFGVTQDLPGRFEKMVPTRSQGARVKCSLGASDACLARGMNDAPE